MVPVLEIACDEAGHTGPDLLARDQRYFAYASVAVTDAEAAEMIRQVRADHRVQMPELKASRLMGTERGRRLVIALLRTITGRYTVSLNDKLLALCAWFFEYIYEPVYQDDPSLLYEKNLHRFVAMYTWLWMTDHESQARPVIEQFQKYMRSRDPADAPFLFDRPMPPLSDDGIEHPFEMVLRFAYGYRDIIIADNARLDTALPDQGRWTLDLSVSGLWSHLNYWGRTGKLLSVHCDASKPLEANAAILRGDARDPGIRRAQRFHKPQPLGWKLSEPISFVDSADHAAVQLADVVAGALVAIPTRDYPEEYRDIAEELLPHLNEHSIMPDTEIVDPSIRSAAVNALMLFDLAKRAERRGDPYYRLAEMYHMAEVSFVRGDFSRIVRGIR